MMLSNLKSMGMLLAFLAVSASMASAQGNSLALARGRLRPLCKGFYTPVATGVASTVRDENLPLRFHWLHRSVRPRDRWSDVQCVRAGSVFSRRHRRGLRTMRLAFYHSEHRFNIFRQLHG
jgi:hypothetical protein